MGVHFCEAQPRIGHVGRESVIFRRAVSFHRPFLVDDVIHAEMWSYLSVTYGAKDGVFFSVEAGPHKLTDYIHLKFRPAVTSHKPQSYITAEY